MTTDARTVQQVEQLTEGFDKMARGLSRNVVLKALANLAAVYIQPTDPQSQEQLIHTFAHNMAKVNMSGPMRGNGS